MSEDGGLGLSTSSLMFLTISSHQRLCLLKGCDRVNCISFFGFLTTNLDGLTGKGDRTHWSGRHGNRINFPALGTRVTG